MKLKEINNFFKNKKVLVIGHTGFKGSWLVACLKNFRSKVYGISKDPVNKQSKFADDPLLTKTLYFTPNHSDHNCSNSLTLFPEVNLGSFSCNRFITGFKSFSSMLFFISGYFMSFLIQNRLNDR